MYQIISIKNIYFQIIIKNWSITNSTHMTLKNLSWRAATSWCGPETLTGWLIFFAFLGPDITTNGSKGKCGIHIDSVSNIPGWKVCRYVWKKFRKEVVATKAHFLSLTATAQKGEPRRLIRKNEKNVSLFVHKLKRWFLLPVLHLDCNSKPKAEPRQHELFTQ